MRMRLAAYPRTVVTALVVVTLALTWTSVAAGAPVLDPGPPSIESLSVSQVSSHRATLVAQIDPDQLETTYEFWLKYAVCQNPPINAGVCDAISVAKVGEGKIAAGPTGQDVSATVIHLHGGYKYDYWIVAKNVVGEKRAEQTFIALPNPTVQSESVSGLAPNPVELHATIDPNGQAVYYQFQLVSDPNEYASELSCPVLPIAVVARPVCVGQYARGALPIGRLEAASGPREVSLDLNAAGVSLKVGSTYHYRVLVAPAVQTEDTVQWEGPPTIGADQAFSVGEDDVGPPPAPTTADQSPAGGSGSSDDGSGGSTSGGGSISSGGGLVGAPVPPAIAAPTHKLTPAARPSKAKHKARKRRRRRHRKAKVRRHRRHG